MLLIDNTNTNSITFMPKRIQRKRNAGYNMNKVSKELNGLDCVYVGRGSRWGNPFKIIKYSDGLWGVESYGRENFSNIIFEHCKTAYNSKKEAAYDAVKCYSMWLLSYTHEKGDMLDFLKSNAVIQDIIHNLSGKNLSCWCAADDICHADVLLRLANDTNISYAGTNFCP